jgi:hypothetical protein
MNKFEALTLTIKNKEADLIAEIDDMLIEAGMQAFVDWANAFPKRYVRFVSGMGTATFACPSLDNSCFLLELDDYCDTECSKTYYSPRAAAMVQPMVDFNTLFWSFDIYQYPAIPDILYNPITRTVECGEKIIHLDEES